MTWFRSIKNDRLVDWAKLDNLPLDINSELNNINSDISLLNINKVDKVTWKGLSTEDYTTTEKNKLAWIEAGAEVNVNPDWNSVSWDSQILNKPTIPTNTSDLTNDSVVSSVVAWTNVTIDNTDPRNPIISSSWWGWGTPWSTVVSETSFWQSTAVWTSTNYAREDHSHWTPTAQDLSWLVPYTWATWNVDLWTNSLTAKDTKITDNNLYVWDFLNDKQENWISPTEVAKFTRSYDFSTRILTLIKTQDWYYYVNGKRFDVTTDVVFPAHDTTYGTKFFYFDSTWTASTSNTVWDVLTTAQVSYTFYNSSNADTVKSFTANECHGLNMSSKEHLYNHLVFWTKLISWGAIWDYTIKTQTTSAVSYSVATARLFDEDIDFNTTAQTDWWPYTLMYRSWASWEWNWTTTSTLPYFIWWGLNIQWNEFTWSTWQLTEATSNGSYINYYVVATNLDTYSCLIIPSQTRYTSLANAQAENFSSLNLWSSIPFQEFVPLYQITMRREWSYSTTTWRARIEATPRTIASPTSWSFSITWSHSALSNLSNDDHLQYQRTCNVQSITADYTFTWTETRNSCFSTDTTSWNITVSINPALFSVGTEINIGKPVAANTITIDALTWNNINWSQTFTVTDQWDVVTLIVINATTIRTKSMYRNNAVTSSRTLTINWTSYDLSADRSWTVQEPLVNQTNIKSINWISLLWSWNITLASMWIFLLIVAWFILSDTFNYNTINYQTFNVWWLAYSDNYVYNTLSGIVDRRI